MPYCPRLLQSLDPSALLLVLLVNSLDVRNFIRNLYLLLCAVEVMQDVLHLLSALIAESCFRSRRHGAELELNQCIRSRSMILAMSLV